METVMFGDPFYSTIIDQLSPIDLYNLTRVCTLYNKTIDKIKINRFIIDTINVKLQTLFLYNVDSFKLLLNSYSCFISGDFVLESILGVYESKNIAIYTKQEGYVYISEFLLSLDYKNQMITHDNYNYNSFTKNKSTIVVISYSVENISVSNTLRFFDSLKHLYFYEDFADIIRIRMDLVSHIHAREYYTKNIEYPCL